jgi:hypothetical protein
MMYRVSKNPPQAARQKLAAIGVHPSHSRNVPLQLAIPDQCRNHGGDLKIDGLSNGFPP